MSETPSNSRHLALATVSFAVSFAVWGLISAFAPRFRELYSLTGTQTALLVALPVLLGSVGRFAMGLLADRFGGRAVACCSSPASASTSSSAESAGRSGEKP